MAKAVKLKTKQAKKKTGREVKVQAVAALTDKVGKAKTMIFTNYRGLTHKQIETIKKKVKTLDAEYVITKNTLLKRSLESKNLKLEDEKALDQQTATLF
ncbi:MAG TPA: 50S ribosomal protein L10, partial [Candidatus Saccharimonadales bacterium]|nr:50S ribosomal protein L10 [Candidatus Saccharimonadales bacterium]